MVDDKSYDLSSKKKDSTIDSIKTIDRNSTDIVVQNRNKGNGLD